MNTPCGFERQRLLLIPGDQLVGFEAITLLESGFQVFALICADGA
jgi:hypothetical protein